MKKLFIIGFAVFLFLTGAVAQPMQPASGASGIVISRAMAGSLTQGAGGFSKGREDIKTLLSDYGTAEDDTGAHPEVVVYEGPPMDPSLGGSCRIPYLMPIGQAEKLLVKNRGMVMHSKAVAPGFPDGLYLHTYDIRFGNYNRMTIVTDSAKPEQQVVSILFKNERENWHPLHFKLLKNDWSTYDYVNTRHRSDSGIVINTRVNDMTAKGGYIVVNTAFGVSPPVGPTWLKVNYRPSETSTWYLPVPMIKLILFSLAQEIRK